MIDDQTRKEIDKAVVKTLKEAGLREPPFLIHDLLEFLKIDRDFYNLEDPGLLRRFWHHVKVKGRILSKIKEKIKLAAVWLPDRDRIYVDSSLPAPKQEWASFHDVTHTILKWHRPFFLGDTAQTLHPDFQKTLEAEANYGASALMFGSGVFTREARDISPEWKSIELLKKRYEKSYVTTLRRYVQFSHEIPMAVIVNTPWWKEKPDDQEHRCRHFVCSDSFKTRFACVTRDHIISEIDNNTLQRVGGPVGDFTLCLPDVNGDNHEFHAESFFNRHYLLTLVVHFRKLRKVGLIY
ncbi:MAG: hypothetical protein JRI36_06030 [Deltaproteobacteria bacterium]|nr:hypothetical protein [Deltaproteobacteria bacterium]